MADFLSKPQTVLQIDDKAGNSYLIYTVQHVATPAGDENAVRLDPTVFSGAHLNATGQTNVTVTVTASDTFTTVSFPSESASGSYVIVCRGSGTGAGVGGFKGDL